jgi:ribonuclease Z
MGRVIFIGTGDPLNGERTQSCLAVPLAHDETMLFDTASGTDILRQLESAGIALESVRHLFISHRHFDHAGGLAPLLTALVPLPNAAIAVHAAPDTLRALRELLLLTIPGVEDWLGKRLRWRELALGRTTEAGNARVSPFEVDHGVECVGFRISQGASTLVYAADTRPCENVVEHARGADLLIHEAYGLEDETERAHTLGHSTAEEAGEIARRAKARRLVLTHIRASAFVDTVDLAAEAKAAFGGTVEVAGDLDSFDFGANSAGTIGTEGQ